MELWDRGLHAGLVRDAEAEGAAQEGRAASGGKEEEESVAQSYHNTVLSGNLQQAVCRATDTEGGGCLLPDDQCTKTGRPVVEVLREKHPDMCVPPVENPMCAAFKEYEEVPETVPLTSCRMTSRGLHQSSSAQQVRWEQRRSSCEIGSFALEIRLRS